MPRLNTKLILKVQCWKKYNYENDYIAYQKKLAEYEIAKKQYTDAKQAYDKIYDRQCVCWP